MSSSSAGTRSSLHAFLWQAGTKIKSPLPITALLQQKRAGARHSACFAIRRSSSFTSSVERPGLLVRKSSKSTAEPHIRRKNFRSVNVIQPFQCSFINSVGDASGVIDRGHCPVHRHTFCNGKTRTVQNLGSGPHSHRPTYHTDVFVPLRQ